MKVAGVLALLLGLLLGGIAIMDLRDDANGAAGRISRGSDDIIVGDRADLDRLSREADDRKAAQNHEWVGCAAFLIAGIALVSVGKSKSESDLPSTSGEVAL